VGFGTRRPPSMRNIRVMTSQGRPLSRLRRALENGSVLTVPAAAAEMSNLNDALKITLLIEAQDEDRYERAVARWVGRCAMECPRVGIHELRMALNAFESIPDASARKTLEDLASWATR
jgi:hypothetical protein